MSLTTTQKREEAFDKLPLETLAEVANAAAEAAVGSWGKALEQADRCGRALLAAKAQVRHGEWMRWLKENFDHSTSTAERWMRLAENSSRVPNLASAKSMNEALRMIEEHHAPASLQDEATGDEGDDELNNEAGGDEAGDEVDTTPPADTRPARPARVVDDATAPTPTPIQAEPTLRRQRFHDEFRKVLKTGPKGRDKAQQILTECLHSLAAASSREDC
jgi:hypothetical protein